MSYLKLAGKDLAELRGALEEEKQFLARNDFPLKRFTEYSLGDILIKVRNHYETDTETRRKLALREKVKYDIILRSLEHLTAQDKDLSERATRKDLSAAIEEAKEYFKQEAVGPRYNRYADTESIAHMPKFRYLDKAEDLYINLYLALSDYLRAVLAADKDLPELPGFSGHSDLDTVADAIFASLIDGTGVSFHTQSDLEFLAELEEALEL